MRLSISSAILTKIINISQPHGIAFSQILTDFDKAQQSCRQVYKMSHVTHL